MPETPHVMTEKNESFAVMNGKLEIKQQIQRITGKIKINAAVSNKSSRSKLSSELIITSIPGIIAHNPATNPFFNP